MPLAIPPGTDLSKLPALAPPHGVVPNFIDPESRAHAVLVGSGIITAITLIFVILRFYTKAFVMKAVGWEDAACLTGTIMSVGYVGLLGYVFHTGIGAHQWNVHLTVFLNEYNIKAIKATNFLYGPMMIFAKLSILLLYFHLFSANKMFRILIYVGIITTLLNHVIGTVLAITLCIPSDPVGYSKCAHRLNPLDVVISVINILSDFYILLLPLFVISTLQMRRNKKIAVGAVFCTGFLACVSSIAGLSYRVVQWHAADTSWWLGPLLVLSLVEIDIGLIVGCMPILPALVNHERGFKSLAPYFSSLRSQFHRSFHTKESSGHSRSKEYRLTRPSYPEGFHGTPKESSELAYVESLAKEPSMTV